MSNIGFIGVGYMGYGIAKNILKHGHKLFVVANKNRKPIEKFFSTMMQIICSLILAKNLTEINKITKN